VLDLLSFPTRRSSDLDFLKWVNPAAAAVVRVLEAHQPRADQVLVVGPNLALQLAEVKDAVVTFERPAGDAAVNSRAAGFIQVDEIGRAHAELQSLAYL